MKNRLIFAKIIVLLLFSCLQSKVRKLSCPSKLVEAGGYELTFLQGNGSNYCFWLVRSPARIGKSNVKNAVNVTVVGHMTEQGITEVTTM